MKYLIVNADDFGASRGINRGIVEGHERGIVTSASLLVNAPGSKDAADLCERLPSLSVGLHVQIRVEVFESSTELRGCLPELLRHQFERFERLTGRSPTHLDSHHNIHRDSRALPFFQELAREKQIPLREYSIVRHFPKFYGQWDGCTHWEQISPENLAHMLATEIEPGITELSCHPGYVEDAFSSSYRAEREAELRALTNPLVRHVLREQQIQLIGFHEIRAFVEKRRSPRHPYAAA